MQKIPLVHILAVAAGGAIGSMARYVVSTWFVQSLPPTWPWGTFLVNIAGCLLIGGIMAISWKHPNGDIWKLLLASGFCGGFTTFSAFSNEGFIMLRHEMYKLYAAYACSSLFLGIAAVAAGFFATKKFFL